MEDKTLMKNEIDKLSIDELIDARLEIDDLMCELDGIINECNEILN